MYWLAKAESALASARAERESGRYDFSVNRSYYACFYAASAVLLLEDRRFVKHSGLRSAVHRDLVRAGRVEAGLGRSFDALSQARQSVDYVELYEERFVTEMKRLLGK